MIRLDSKIKKSFDDIISHPLTASVFLYLKNQNRPAGVREVQKALNFNSPSTAYWHLNKLRDNGIITQLQDDKYQVQESYQDLKKIPLTVTLDHYILAGKNIPEIIILLTFLISISVAIFLMILFGLWFHAALIGFLSIISTILLILRFYYRFSFPQKEGD